ncbi:hypothetical protein SPI_07501 [Niveomyces insectorum RCEF 264]|uniref:VWFA domain-containing protein n=1 Tax=Niveomyces insectorum RCEF 264 TaxID=1081102 RepID=A0A167PXP3_9HYPO|nr:hypothetical protein SPI_07501 [Niveomyces insectorum RCEF 264]
MSKDKMDGIGIYDLLIVTDATASMGAFLHSLNVSPPKIIRISTLTRCFSRIGIVAYRDYCGGELTNTADVTVTREQLLDFAKALRRLYGGDWPEVTETGLAVAYDNMRENAETVVVVYADVPPHTPATRSADCLKEKKALESDQNRKKYGINGPQFVDWMTSAAALQHCAPPPG